MSYRPSLRGPPIGGQDRDGASYRCSAPYTLSRFAGLRPGGKHVTGFSDRFALLQIQFLCHLKGKERYEEKNSESYTSRTISAFSPFGGERSEPITRMLNMPYDTESQSRNADFISIAAERQSATLGAKGPVKLTNPPAKGRSILRTFSFTTLLHNPRRQPRPLFIAAMPPPQPSA